MLKIAYLRVEDRDYPRNARLRAFLEKGGHQVRVSDRARGGRMVRSLRDVWRIFRDSRGTDIVIVSEFSLPFVPVAWVAARLARATLVVDGFVGKYETVVEDWGTAAPNSLKARWCRIVDATAAKMADIYLADTELRAQMVRSRHRTSATVLSLPVGAPDWVTPQQPSAAANLRVLFYGSVLPLHGIPTILKGLARTTDRSITLTLVGGERMAEHREHAERLGISGRCDFVGPVPSADLNRIIADHDVVLGTFGDSAKARSVIANKVWQGLAAGRTVVTGANPAMNEIQPIVGTQLVQVTGASGLALALDDLASRESAWYPGAAAELESYVAERFGEIGARLQPAPIVLHAIDDMSGGGAQRVLTDLALHAAESGIGSIVVGGGGSSIGMLPANAVFVEVKQHGFFALVRSLDRACRMYRPVILHAHQRREALACLLLSPVHRIPVVEHAHTVLPDKRLKVLSFRSRVNFSVGPAVTTMLRRDFGRSADRIIEIGNAVPPRALVPKPPHRPRPDKPLTVLAVGRLAAQKNPRAFVQLVKALAHTTPVKATWLGDGELRNDTERYAAECGVAIEFPGHTDLVIPHLDDADVLLLTSNWEGNPLIALEAFARRIPVAGYSVPGVAETLADGRGIMLDAKTPFEVQAAHIRSALETDRPSTVEAAAVYAERFSTPAAVYAPVLDTYDRVRRRARPLRSAR